MAAPAHKYLWLATAHQCPQIELHCLMVDASKFCQGARERGVGFLTKPHGLAVEGFGFFKQGALQRMYRDVQETSDDLKSP